MTCKETTMSYGFIATTLNGHPAAITVHRDDEGRWVSLLVPSVDQDARVYATRDAALAEARRRWGRA